MDEGSAMRCLPAQLTLPFLEQREYLHGTTLFDALLEFVPPGASLCYTFSRIIRSNRIEIVQVNGNHEQGKALSVTLTYHHDKDHGALGVIPLPPFSAVQRCAYKESLVTERARFFENGVELEGPWPFSFVATIVPLHKALLARIINPATPGQWFFTRLEVTFLPQPSDSLMLMLDSVLGNKLAKTAVYGAGKHIGSIYFSWVEKR